MILLNFMQRKKTKKIRIGDTFIGGNTSIKVQSMTNTDTRDVKSTIEQIKRLEAVGCDIVRLAVPDDEAADSIADIKKAVKIPIVADIHFDYRLAIKSIKNGADKIRLNPGNIGDAERVQKVVEVAKEYEVPIRVGVNAGSLEKTIFDKYGGITPDSMVESAFRQSKILEDMGFENIVFALKASNVPLTIAAYKKMSQITEYPLHVGITEAGTVFRGAIKSSVGIGSLLSLGIGDTIRVSLTGEPEKEVEAGIEILKSLGLCKRGIELISCPTCGRCQVDLIGIANKIEDKIKGIDKNIKVAVMGCAVNGPGEAKEADIGVAGGRGEMLLFKKGEIVRKISEERVVEELMREIEGL